MQTPQNTKSLSDLRKVHDYQTSVAHIFPSEQSIRWFIRLHKATLEASGALLIIAGRLWVDPAKFDQTVFDIATGTCTA